MNRTNDYIQPTRGFDINFSQDIAGLGGDVNYLAHRTALARSIRAFAPGWTLSGRLEAGYIDSWGDEGIRINNRFFKGGNSFRGFDIAGLGPREVALLLREYRLPDASTTSRVKRSHLMRVFRPARFSIPLLNSDGTQAGQRERPAAYFDALRRDASPATCCRQRSRSFNALGGKAYAIGSLELSFPIPYAPGGIWN